MPAYTAHPVWPFSPNWESGILERLEWKTDLMSSETKEEQRVSRRLTPRRSFEASFLLSGKKRQYLDVLITAKGSSEFLIPLWHTVTQTSAVSNSGTAVLFLDTAFREFRVGDLVIVRDLAFEAYEIGVVLSMTGSSLTLVSNLDSTWPQGSWIYPARIATIDMSMSTTKGTDTINQFTARFQLRSANPYASGIGALPTYQGYPVLNIRPDESEDLIHEYQRSLVIHDNDFGIPDVYDSVGHGAQAHTYRWAFKGRPSHDTLRQLLYTLRGRAGTVWLPTFMQDFTVVADIVAANGYIDVANIGYTSLGARLEGRRDIRIELVSGVAYYRGITANTVISSTVERLTLSSNLPADVLARDILAVSYVTRSRLDQDSVEIDHRTDIDGLTVCTATWAGPVKYNTNAVIWPAPLTLTDCDCAPPITGFCIPTVLYPHHALVRITDPSDGVNGDPLKQWLFSADDTASLGVFVNLDFRLPGPPRGTHELRTNTTVSGGCRYAEMRVIREASSGGGANVFGVINEASGRIQGMNIDGYAYDSNSGMGAAIATGWHTGQVIGIAYRDGHLWFANNNVWGGNPVTGASPAHSGIFTAMKLELIYTLQGPDVEVQICTNASQFTYTPPVGFAQWAADFVSG